MDKDITKPSIKKKFIDIEQIIKSKNETLYKLMPGFIISYLKRVLHQDAINDFIDRNGHLTGIQFIDQIVVEFGCEISYTGLENIPATGGCVLAANHPLGGLDAMSLMHVVAKKRTDMRFVVNDILMNLKNLSDVFVPVNKHGKTSSEGIQMINKQFESNAVTLVFPAGLVSRKQQGEIKDLVWKKSFVTKAKKYQRDIIPVYVEGYNSSFFYNLALWRKRLGIKANIEMFFLVDEMYKQQGKKIRIIFGKPISWSSLDKSKTDEAWAFDIYQKVYDLKSSANEVK